MGHLRLFRGKILWAPVGAVLVIGALLAGTMFASAAAPSLPKKTPAQLLAAMRHAKLPPALTAVISESADLGFPALPDIAGLPSSALSAASWLAGSHTVQIWYSGPRHIRIAIPVSFGETDLRVNGSQIWLWESQGQVATHIIPVQPAGLVGPLWRFSHLRPAQVAHIPAFLQQRARVSFSAPPVLPGTAPARMKRLLQKLRAVQAKGVPLPAKCAAVSGWRIIKRGFSGNGNNGGGFFVNGNSGGGFVNVWRPAGLRLPTSQMVRMAPAKLRVLLKSRARAIAMTLHVPMSRAIRISIKQAKAYLTLNTANTAPPGLALGAVKAVTPLQAAQRLLAMLGPTTKVSVTGTTVVAGRPAYQLSIEPRSDQSLIGQILIAVDGTSYLPLQVQVIPRGSSSPVFQIGFTTLTPGQPAASNFAFTPPPGAHVHTVKLTANPLAGLMRLPGLTGLGGMSGMYAGQAGAPIAAPPVAVPGVRVHVVKLNGHITKIVSSRTFSTSSPLCWRHLFGVPPLPTVVPIGPRVLGSGWLSVLEIPVGPALGILGGAGPVTPKPVSGAYHSRLHVNGSAGQLIAMLRMLLNSATRVHGAWGSGKLISTRLVNILITSKGQILVGAVTPAVLYADAAKVQ
jgi:hypothetical protein